MNILRERKGKKMKRTIQIKFRRLVRSEKFRKALKTILFIVGVTVMVTPTVYAAEDDPLSVINNLSNFIFEIVQAVGVIMVLFGIVQFGIALKSHDPSQRANSLFTVVGGLIIAFSKVILNTIMG